MIPILYEENETSYVHSGLGRLTDCLSCSVSETLNGPYELTLTYPITGIHYSDIREGRIILAEPNEGGTWQPFIIYRISRPLNGVVTVSAEHISYLLNKVVIMPFSASSVAQALTNIPNYAANTCPFSFMTDKTATGPFEVDYPRAARGLLGGEAGSILDVYGKGEYEFDRFRVNLWVNRGTDKGVTIRYGKNLTQLVRDSDIQNTYTGIVPYWKNQDETVTLSEKVVWSDYRHIFAYDIVKPVDFSTNWTEKPTENQLRTAAQNYVANNEGWKINENIKISFVALWQTEEYKSVANVERVKMGDTVHAIYDALGVSVAAEVIKTDYNVLLERYNSIELGAKQNTLGTVLKDTIAPAVTAEANSFTQAAIDEATKLITGANGGHVIIATNADGEPTEIFIMDTDNVSTAQNVLRMNMNGIGFSSHGVDGPFTTAWTIDGSFVANFITSGILNANVIRAGIIQDKTGGNYWNLDTGEFHLSGIDNAGLNLTSIYNRNEDGTATILAKLYNGMTDVTADYDSTDFVWYKRSASGDTFLSTGYQITIDPADFGLQEIVVLKWLQFDTEPLTVSQGALTVSQGELMIGVG